MLIDSHVHLLAQEGYAERLVGEMDRLGIGRACLLAMQNIEIWGSRAATNEQVEEAAQRFPKRFIPFGYVELGVDPPTLVDELFMRGFKGLKLTRSRYAYNDDRLMDYYEHAARYNMVLLFHTGTVVRTASDRYYDVDSSRLRPIFLDRIARRFPEISIIGAHLGNPWYEEAAMTLFWNPNVYFDLSGTTLKRKSAEWFRETLWWFPERMEKLSRSKETHYQQSHPFDRICFGSDVPINEMEGCIEDYDRLFDGLNLSEELRAKVRGGNIARMFGIETNG
ncbi:MAG TPA: amidohydrolase family protein [Spirochaetia bacterium]|nr:amidohydrolase family protein [Spirochaetia bacterium]